MDDPIRSHVAKQSSTNGEYTIIALNVYIDGYGVAEVTDGQLSYSIKYDDIISAKAVFEQKQMIAFGKVITSVDPMNA